MSKRIQVKQVRSHIRHERKQLDTLRALGLGRIGKTAVHTVSESTLGMIRAVSHLVTVHEVGL